MTAWRWQPTAPAPVKRSAFFGPSTSRFLSYADIGKAVTGHDFGQNELGFRLARLGDEIYGFIDSIEPTTVNSGYNFGGIRPIGIWQALVGPSQGLLGAAVGSFTGAITGTVTFTITGNTSTGISIGNYVIADGWTNATTVSGVTTGSGNTVVTLSAPQTNAASATLKFSAVASTGVMKLGDLVVADTQTAVGTTPPQSWARVSAYPNDFLSYGKAAEQGFLDYSGSAPGTPPSNVLTPTATVITAPSGFSPTIFWRVVSVGNNPAASAGAIGDVVTLYRE